VAGKTRLAAKHSQATKVLMSKLSKENPDLINKRQSEEFIAKISARMSGSNNPYLVDLLLKLTKN
jgi:hypothetical protein